MLHCVLMRRNKTPAELIDVLYSVKAAFRKLKLNLWDDQDAIDH